MVDALLDLCLEVTMQNLFPISKNKRPLCCVICQEYIAHFDLPNWVRSAVVATEHDGGDDPE